MVAIYTVPKLNKTGYTVDVEIDGHKVTMQLDTGTAASIIPTRLLQSYSGERLDLLVELQVLVKCGSQVMTLPLVVSCERQQNSTVIGLNTLSRDICSA